jgi:hypothetical protein
MGMLPSTRAITRRRLRFSWGGIRGISRTMLAARVHGDQTYVSGLNPVILMAEQSSDAQRVVAPKHYGISFDSNGGYSSDFSSGNGADYDGLGDHSPELESSGGLQRPSPYVYREGYTFTGWDLSPSPPLRCRHSTLWLFLPTTVPMSTLVTLASPPPNERRTALCPVEREHIQPDL